MANEFRRQRIAPDGNCLFASIHFCCRNGEVHPDAAQALREHCALTVLSDKTRYTELYLEKDPDDYAEWIRGPLNYGGAIEIFILADFLQVTISIINLQQENLTVITYPPEAPVEEGKKRNIYILYTGQHYDAIVSIDGRCMFEYSDEETVKSLDALAISLATEEKRKWELELRTRQRKKIKCSCGVIVDDAEAFKEHATTVDHGDDWGYECSDIVVEELVSNVTDN